MSDQSMVELLKVLLNDGMPDAYTSFLKGDYQKADNDAAAENKKLSVFDRRYYGNLLVQILCFMVPKQDGSRITIFDQAYCLTDLYKAASTVLDPDDSILVTVMTLAYQICSLIYSNTHDFNTTLMYLNVIIHGTHQLNNKCLQWHVMLLQVRCYQRLNMLPIAHDMLSELYVHVPRDSSMSLRLMLLQRILFQHALETKEGMTIEDDILRFVDEARNIAYIMLETEIDVEKRRAARRTLHITKPLFIAAKTMDTAQSKKRTHDDFGSASTIV
jgi:hypothetical protein